MTEKRKPTYDLAAFKSACNSVECLNITEAAFLSAMALNFGKPEIVEIIQTMQRSHFYKSMTSYRDHRIWQDVYHVPSEAEAFVRQIYRRCRDGVFAAFVQGEGK